MNIFWNTLKFIGNDLVGNILYFPVWWYSVGSFRILQKIVKDTKSFAHDLHLGILFKYLFKPMYGLTDFWSRIISFLVRIVQFIILSFTTFIWLSFLFFCFITWLLLPILVLYSILFQLNIINYQLIK